MRAYVLINVRIGAIPEVIGNLQSVLHVIEAEMTFGEYDVIAAIEAEDVKALANVVSREIQTIPDITHTTTCIAIDLD